MAALEGCDLAGSVYRHVSPCGTNAPHPSSPTPTRCDGGGCSWRRHVSSVSSPLRLDALACFCRHFPQEAGCAIYLCLLPCWCRRTRPGPCRATRNEAPGSPRVFCWRRGRGQAATLSPPWTSAGTGTSALSVWMARRRAGENIGGGTVSDEHHGSILALM